jgi:FtsP/CotA-like multicopper oxidase with cupredoxin domain
MVAAGRRRRVPRLAVPLVVALLLVVPLGWMWADSRPGGRYSVMSMGFPDYGGGRIGTRMTPGMPAGHEMPGPVDPTTSPMRRVTDLTVGPARVADVRVDLVARQQSLDIGGRTVPGYTLNGTSPGPTIRAVVGQLLEVHLTNASVPAGVSVHWHGVDVPNAMDGVAGVTQDEVPVGGEFTYRFVLDNAGTYWYHSHQVSDTQVAGGLLGALVVQPAGVAATSTSGRTDDVTATAHVYGGIRTVNGHPGDLRVDARPGARVRVRIINTDNGPMQVWADSPYRLLAIDGNDVHEPALVTGKSIAVTAGGRIDLEVTPADGAPVRVQLSKATAVVVGPVDAPSPHAPVQPTVELDPLGYGMPAPLRFDPAKATRHFDYRIGRRPGFVNGRPGLFWSINGHLYPNVPMFMVTEGDVVRMHIENSSGEVHPMHLHGHRAVVLARDGVPATGSPWEFDSLNVRDGESFDIAFVADNPGIWMDHCHNLQHAAVGMIAHLAYEGVESPFLLGSDSGNDPE